MRRRIRTHSLAMRRFAALTRAPIAVLHATVTIAVAFGLISLWRDHRDLAGRTRRLAADACVESGLLNDKVPFLGRPISPYEGTVDLNVDGVGFSYESVSHSGGLSRVAGRIFNPTSVPIYAQVVFSAAAPPPDSIYHNQQLGLYRCRSRSFGRDSVSAVLVPKGSEAFNVVLPTPAGADTLLIGWRVQVSVMVLRDGN